MAYRLSDAGNNVQSELISMFQPPKECDVPQDPSLLLEEVVDLALVRKTVVDRHPLPIAHPIPDTCEEATFRLHIVDRIEKSRRRWHGVGWWGYCELPGRSTAHSLCMLLTHKTYQTLQEDLPMAEKCRAGDSKKM